MRSLVEPAFCSEKIGLIADSSSKKMSDVFDLKYDKINMMALGLLIIVGITTVFCMFIIITACVAPRCCRYYMYCISKIVYIIFYYVILEALVSVCLTISMLAFYSQGEIVEFGDFLECPGIKKEYFNTLSIVTDVKPYLIAFAVINLICEIFTLLLYFKNLPSILCQFCGCGWWP